MTHQTLQTKYSELNKRINKNTLCTTSDDMKATIEVLILSHQVKMADTMFLHQACKDFTLFGNRFRENANDLKYFLISILSSAILVCKCTTQVPGKQKYSKVPLLTVCGN